MWYPCHVCLEPLLCYLKPQGHRALLRWLPRTCPLVSQSLGMISYSLSQHTYFLPYSFRELSKMQYGGINGKRSPENFRLSTRMIPVIGLWQKDY